jgi:hypothetical protein
MPILPEKAYMSEFFKPDDLGLKLGGRKTFEIIGGHDQTLLNQKDVFSLPVKLDGKEGKVNLGKTMAKEFVKKLGTSDTDKWIGAKYDAIVVPVNNPTTGKQTLSWAIDTEAIFPAPS